MTFDLRSPSVIVGSTAGIVATVGYIGGWAITYFPPWPTLGVLVVILHHVVSGHAIGAIVCSDAVAIAVE